MSKMKDIPAVSWRPTVSGNHYAVSTGHALASLAAMRILDQGGNAIDAGVTAAMALAVLQPDIVSFAGVAPTLIYIKEENRVISLAGLGCWPAATDVERLRMEGGAHVPAGILRQILPAAPATHIQALRRYGSISFEQAVTAAYELAREGFCMYPTLYQSLDLRRDLIARYPENAAIFQPGGVTPPIGTRLRQENLAKTIGRMIEAERGTPGNREAKLQAVHDCFYRGGIARDIADFHAKHGGFMTAEDLAGFNVPVEDSIACNYGDYEIHSCDTWCQGIVLLEALKILENADLTAIGHNTPQYLHLLAEALNLAFADREAFIGDPGFVNVPTRHLLGADHAARQFARIDPACTEGRMYEPLEIPGFQAYRADCLAPSEGAVRPSLDTIYACVADKYGNAYSATLSDTMYDTPMIDGMGLLVSSRGSQSRLDPAHPASVRPGKRPRLTPTPALALRDGHIAMAWGTPGGDVQCQAMLQVFLNAMTFGMDIQAAIEAPRVATFNFPDSFAPHTYLPGRLCVENRIEPDTVRRLREFGYDVEMWSAIAWRSGAVCAIVRNPSTGLLHAGADPRRPAYALAW
ncbi:Gamma-glutamyltransferase [Bordetella sputigena]|uniref:gamma-glutamyltransferase family protein n=1 Tax=Bordetella sputigena TaxID=1416810 RepID=UPI0039F0312A